MPRSRFVSPIVFSDFASGINLNAGSTFQFAAETNLRNSLDVPFALERVRFSFFVATPGVSLWHGHLWPKFRIGRQDITDGFVPLPVLCKRRDVELESATILGAGARAFQTLTWQLPVPLIIPPGELMRHVLQISPDYTAGSTMSYSVAYVGHPVPSLPKLVDVPWVDPFIGGLQATGTDATEQSGEGDISNPTGKPLRVHHFLGSLPINITTDTGDWNAIGYSNMKPFGLKDVFVQVTDWQGDQVCRDLTRFWTLFSPLDRAWNAKCLIPPMGGFIFNFDERLSQEAGGDNMRLAVAMHATRKVPLGEIY